MAADIAGNTATMWAQIYEINANFLIVS